MLPSRFHSPLGPGLKPRPGASFWARVLLAAGILLLFPAARADSGGWHRGGLYDAAYRPFKADGYIQAWSVGFRSGRVRISLVYLISNIGPGTKNNGVALFFFDGAGQRSLRRRVGTAEYTSKSLNAKPGRIAMSFGHAGALTYAHGRIYAEAKINKTRIQIALRPAGRSVRLSGGRFKLTNPAQFLQVDIPVLAASATATVTIDGTRRVLKGVGGMEHILTNRSPHLYARRFELTRSFGYGRSIVVGGLRGASGQRDHYRAIYAERGKVLVAGTVVKTETISTTKDPLSGYRLFSHVRYHLKSPRTCTITVRRAYRIGGFNVMANVSSLLRWVLKVFFAKPYLAYNRSRIEVHCPAHAGQAEFKQRLYGRTSFYLINP